MKDNDKVGQIGFRTMDIIQSYSLYAVPHYLRKFYPLQIVKPGDVVVDAACGYGELGQVLYVNRSGLKHYYGFDVDPKKIESAKQHVKKEHFQYVTRDLRDPLPIEYNSVDVFISEEFIEHVNKEDAEKFLGEVYRVLKPGGTFLLSTPRQYEGITERLDIGHLYEWGYEELMCKLVTMGFHVLEAYGLGFYERINTLPDELFKEDKLYQAMRKFLPNQFTKTLAALIHPEKANTLYLKLAKEEV